MFGVHVSKEILAGFLFDVTEVAGVVHVVVPKRRLKSLDC